MKGRLELETRMKPNPKWIHSTDGGVTEDLGYEGKMIEYNIRQIAKGRRADVVRQTDG